MNKNQKGKVYIERFKKSKSGKIALLGILWSGYYLESRGYWRIEFASKAKRIDKLAAQFGGGGHKNRSGAKVNTLAEVKRIIAAVIEYS